MNQLSHSNQDSQLDLGEQKGLIKETVITYMQIEDDPKTLLLVEDYQDHRKYLQTIALFPVQESPPMSISCSKVFTHQLVDEEPSGAVYPHYKGQKNEALSLRMFHGNSKMADQEQLYQKISGRKNRVGSFYFERQGSHWYLTHRLIIDAFRRQGMGTRLLQFAEMFIQEIANVTGENQTVIINAGQASVLEFATRSGYQPDSSQDQEKIVSIQGAEYDKDYGLLKIQGVWTPQGDKDLYYFEPDAPLKAVNLAIRVQMTKVIGCLSPEIQ